MSIYSDKVESAGELCEENSAESQITASFSRSTGPFPVQNQRAVGELCRHFGPASLTAAHSLSRKLGLKDVLEIDAEDLFQDSIIRLLKANQNGRLPSQPQEFRAYWLVVLRNLCLDWRRHHGRRPKTISMGEESRQVEDGKRITHQKDSDHNHLTNAIDQAMDHMPENWSSAVRLKIEKKLSYQQIAMNLGCTHQQARTWIYRGRKFLREKIDLIDNEANIRTNLDYQSIEKSKSRKEERNDH